MKSIFTITTLCVLFACVDRASADVKPAALFSDHMVLQQEMAIPVWGTAEAGEQVTVSIGDQKQSAVADAKGKWIVKLSAIKNPAPTEMTIAGKNSVTIKDILLGEVWVGSGQSNMDFSVSKKAKYFAGVENEDQEIAAANYPQIRMFTVKLKMADVPQEDVVGKWEVCTPETVPAFSAVGYFFARELLQARHVPVGIITTSFGASTAQAWVSNAALSADERFKNILADYQTAVAKFDSTPATQPATAAPSTAAPAPGAPSSAAPSTVPPSPAEPATRPARGRGGPKNPHTDQHNPSVLWNGMVKPLEPYAIRGAIWYQGESVVGGNELYLPLMQTLITTWRKEWNQGDFPFLFVQLAANKPAATQPAPGGSFARVRESQLQTLTVPNTAMAVTIDIGDAKNVHPKNKQDVGKRLALAARAMVYGEKVEYSGPIYDSMKVEGDKIRIHFKHAADGLKINPGTLSGFAIAGADKNFVYADTKIDGDSVVLSNSDVPKPAAVRYAWADNPPAALYNSAGLPASPFRTDDW